MSDNHIDEAKGRLKDAAGSFTDRQIAENDSHDDQARTTIKDESNNLLDTLPGRGSE
jgi:uncharacterized protein YjbJ (UPF0337 family)